jgi:uncharacterized protein (UPF0210 family)
MLDREGLDIADARQRVRINYSQRIVASATVDRISGSNGVVVTNERIVVRRTSEVINACSERTSTSQTSLAIREGYRLVSRLPGSVTCQYLTIKLTKN